MKTESQKRKLQMESVGVYYLNNTQQKIGFWKDGDRTTDSKWFVTVCVIEINCPFQNAIIEAIKNNLK